MMTRRLLLTTGTAALATAFVTPWRVAAAGAEQAFKVSHKDAECCMNGLALTFKPAVA